MTINDVWLILYRKFASHISSEICMYETSFKQVVYSLNVSVELKDEILKDAPVNGGTYRFFADYCYSKCVKRPFYFTFGHGQPHFGYYHKIMAIETTEALDIMFLRFGTKWSMMYESEEAAGVKEYNLKELK